MATTESGPGEYEIVATATFPDRAADVWALLQDWERFLAVGLPELASDFEWLAGGPDRVPSQFQFTVGDSILKEEIYERSADVEGGKYSLRYRLLEPALGIQEYDAVLELEGMSSGRTRYSAVRDVRLEPGNGPEELVEMVEVETERLRQHFA